MTDPVGRPDNVVVVLLDSLNRHMVGAYGGAEFATPTLDRFAAESVRFDNHYVGSLPCMPARHDVLVGALDFLWRPWGSIEIWEEAITYHLRDAGVATMLVSDHPHLFEQGGENYHTDFHGWEYVRGHENDPWRLAPDPSAVGAPDLPAIRPSAWGANYDTSRTWFREEADFPGPRTMATATDWIRTNAGRHDRWMLFVDAFDPHEPFDTPEPYASMYDPDWDGEKIIWPPYAVGAISKGTMTEEEGRQIRANYGAKLTMIDAWLGRLLDAIDATGQRDSTAVIVCTDHGHYLGEPDVRDKDVWGKPGVPLYETIAHTPLMIRWPGVAPSTVGALTTNVDIHATLCAVFGIEVPHRTHGQSLVPLVTGASSSVREWALAGVFGRWVHVFGADGTKYARSHTGDANVPLSMWSNRWSTMPLGMLHTHRIPRPDKRAVLDFMPGSEVPVIRQPFEAGDPVPYWAAASRGDDHYLFDITEDPTERVNRAGSGSRDESDAIELLRTALLDVEAPAEHLERMGLT